MDLPAWPDAEYVGYGPSQSSLPIASDRSSHPKTNWSAYASETSSEIQRLAKSHFLDQVEAIMPVIREPAMGVHTQRQDFSDSGQHLTLAAALKRSHLFEKAVGQITQTH